MAETSLDYNGTKVCCGCNVEKAKKDYHKCNTRKTGVQSRCKDCMSALKKERYWSNRDVELAKMTKSRLKPENIEQRKGYYQKNKSTYQERHKKYQSDESKRKAKLELSKERYKANRDRIREKQRLNYNKPETKERIRQRHHERKATDIQYNIKRRLRFRLRHIIDGLGSKSLKHKTALQLVGCELSFLKEHIEKQFKEGMSWDRFDEIQIDHIKPCVKFDLTLQEEQEKCFHWTNLQPLWKLDNLRKGSKYSEQ